MEKVARRTVGGLRHERIRISISLGAPTCKTGKAPREQSCAWLLAVPHPVTIAGGAIETTLGLSPAILFGALGGIAVAIFVFAKSPALRAV